MRFFKVGKQSIFEADFISLKRFNKCIKVFWKSQRMLNDKLGYVLRHFLLLNIR